MLVVNFLVSLSLSKLNVARQNRTIEATACCKIVVK